jgi:hypothetical protein
VRVSAALPTGIAALLASYQRHRAFLNDWISRLEAAGVVS